jgi:hypothetical protein
MLTGSRCSGHGSSILFRHGQTTLPVLQRGPEPHMSSERNRVSPYRSREGRKAERLYDGDAGKGGERKQMPSCNGMDTDECLARKRADFSLVFNHERT